MPKDLVIANDEEVDQNLESNYDPMKNIQYICSLTDLITEEAFGKGHDIAQLPNGDIIITKTKVVHTYHSWDRNKNKFTEKREFS